LPRILNGTGDPFSPARARSWLFHGERTFFDSSRRMPGFPLPANEREALSRESLE